MKEPKWVLIEVVYSIHSEQLAEHGGREGIRDKGLLESALDAPTKLFHYEKPSIARLAAAYAYRIINNHPFMDGNKRTGYIVSRLFLLLNDFDIDDTDEEKIKIFLGVANNLIEENQLTIWFEKRLIKAFQLI